MIGGYSNMQMARETAGALKTMEDEQWPVDLYTVRGVKYLRDPERLRDAMNRLEEKVSSDASRDSPAKDAAGDRQTTDAG
jgi:hypothetical protein